MEASGREPKPLVVAFVSDLMLLTRIEGACDHLGFDVKDVASAGAIAPEDPLAPEKQAAEPVFGREALLVESLTRWQPALLLFDLGNEAIPWRQWIAVIRTGPATRRIPILAFGPHVEREAMEQARSRGADLVVPRSRFMASMPGLISDSARVPDYQSLLSDCDRPPSDLAILGIEAFNRGDYHEAHEFLEDAWNMDDGPTRNIHKGVLQVAVAYLQIQRGNFMGAVKMLLRARQWLGPLPKRCRGIDIGQLRSDADSVHEAILALGPERLSELDPRLLRPVDFHGD